MPERIILFIKCFANISSVIRLSASRRRSDNSCVILAVICRICHAEVDHKCILCFMIFWFDQYFYSIILCRKYCYSRIVFSYCCDFFHFFCRNIPWSCCKRFCRSRFTIYSQALQFRCCVCCKVSLICTIQFCFYNSRTCKSAAFSACIRIIYNMDFYKHSLCRNKIICIFHDANRREFLWMWLCCCYFCPSSLFSCFGNIYFCRIICWIRCCMAVRSEENLDLIKYLLCRILECNISIIVFGIFAVFIVTPHCRVCITALISVYCSVSITDCFQIIRLHLLWDILLQCHCLFSDIIPYRILCFLNSNRCRNRHFFTKYICRSLYWYNSFCIVSTFRCFPCYREGCRKYCSIFHNRRSCYWKFRVYSDWCRRWIIQNCRYCINHIYINRNCFCFIDTCNCNCSRHTECTWLIDLIFCNILPCYISFCFWLIIKNSIQFCRKLWAVSYFYIVVFGHLNAADCLRFRCSIRWCLCCNLYCLLFQTICFHFHSDCSGRFCRLNDSYKLTAECFSVIVSVRLMIYRSSVIHACKHTITADFKRHLIIRIRYKISFIISNTYCQIRKIFSICCNFCSININF